MIVEVLVFLLRLSHLEWPGFNSLLIGILSDRDLLSDLSFNLLALILRDHTLLFVLIIINLTGDPWMAMLARIGGRNGSAIASCFIRANCVMWPRCNHRRALIIVFFSLMIPCNSNLVLTTGVVRVVVGPLRVGLLLYFGRNIIVACWREARIVVNLRTQLRLRLY